MANPAGREAMSDLSPPSGANAKLDFGRTGPLMTQLGPPELMHAHCRCATGRPGKIPFEAIALSCDYRSQVPNKVLGYFLPHGAAIWSFGERCD